MLQGQSTKSEIVISSGPKGSFFYKGENMIIVEPKKVPLVDTIGAGEAHTGTVSDRCSMASL